MTPMGWLIGLSVSSWVVVVAIARGAFIPEISAGMLGPLVAACASWLAVARTQRTAPTRVQHVMLQSFILKLLFFCVYIIVMLRVVTLQPTPFALSFAGYFIGLYVTQAILMHRLFGSAAHASA